MTLTSIFLSIVPIAMVFFIMQAQINDLNERLNKMTRA